MKRYDMYVDEYTPGITETDDGYFVLFDDIKTHDNEIINKVREHYESILNDIASIYERAEDRFSAYDMRCLARFAINEGYKEKTNERH